MRALTWLRDMAQVEQAEIRLTCGMPFETASFFRTAKLDDSWLQNVLKYSHYVCVELVR